MAEIPQVDPHVQLAEWFKLKKELDALKWRESDLRRNLVQRFFPDAPEGTNTYKLPDEYQLKGVIVINRTVDPAMLSSLAEHFRENGIDVGSLIEYKPDLNLKAYRALSEDKRHLFDQCLIIKEGSPQLKITDPPKTAAPK